MQPNSSKAEVDSGTGTAPEWFCTPAEYEQYLSRSLPARVQRELEKQVQEELDFVGDETQARAVVGLVQRMQMRLFRQFEQERGRNPAGGEGNGG